jgi:peptidylprolyl isomerase
VIEVSGEANGTIVIDLLPEVAPQHVEQIVALAREGAYDGVVFHRVIDGFMAQTGDVEFGRIGRRHAHGRHGRVVASRHSGRILGHPFERGVVGMARAQSPDSANSQFFIMFADGDFLNGQYTVFGRVIEGMDVVDAIKRGEGQNGAVVGQPDVMATVTVVELKDERGPVVMNRPARQHPPNPTQSTVTDPRTTTGTAL